MADAARVDAPAEPPGVRMENERPQLGALLRDGGFITENQLSDALSEGALTGARLGEVVVSRGWASEDDVAKALAEQWGLGYVDRASIWFDAGALARMSREQAQRLEALPTRVQDGRVVVAVAEPTEQRLAALREVIGEDTVVVVVPKTALDVGLRSELLSGAPAKAGPEQRAPEPPPLRTTYPAEVQPLEAAQPLETAQPPEENQPPADGHPLEAEPAAAPYVDAPAPPPTWQPEPEVHQPPPEAAGTESSEPEAAGLLAQLQQAAREAASLQRSVGDLAGRLDQLAAGLEAVAARLARDQSEDERARIDHLQEQLEQRTELTERLRAQLNDLARTLDTLD